MNITTLSIMTTEKGSQTQFVCTRTFPHIKKQFPEASIVSENSAQFYLEIE